MKIYQGGVSQKTENKARKAVQRSQRPELARTDLGAAAP
jgi:hypothetical protein